MANQSSVQVIEKNEGPKIDYEQSGTKLFFGDDEIMINCAKYQKDWPVDVDICSDRYGNLVISPDSGMRYVAQIAIPQAEYEPREEGDTDPPVKIPLDMGDVVLTLWSIA